MRAWIAIVLLSGCGGGAAFTPVANAVAALPFEIDFCHVSRLAVDPATGRVFILDEPEESPDIVTAADCDPLQWMVLSPGAGRSLSRATAMTWDSRARRLILFERFSGDILGLSGQGGAPRVLTNVRAGGVGHVERMAFDPVGNRVVVVDVDANAVAVFDLDEREWSDLAGPGPDFVFPGGIVVDAARDRLLVCDSGLDRIVAVDLTTGARTLFGAPGVSSPRYIDIDPVGDRAFVCGRTSLVEFDLATGGWVELAPHGGAVEDMDYDACGNRLLINGVILVNAFDLATLTTSLFAR